MEEGVGFGGEGGEGFAVAHAGPFGAEFIFLAGAKCGGVDFFDFMFELFGAALEGGLVFGEAFDFAANVVDFIDQGGEGEAHLGQFGVTIQQVDVGTRIEQREVFALTVDIDQQRTDGLEDFGAGGDAIDAGCGAAVAFDFTGEGDVFVAVAFHFLTAEDGNHLRLRGFVEGEHPFDDGFIRTRADE